MNNRFFWAAKGDLESVRADVREHPDKINSVWDGKGYDPFATKTGKAVLATWAVANTGVAIANPIAGLVSSLVTQVPVNIGALIHRTFYENNHTGRTMLEFAAEAGETAVATFLIMNGANTNNHFRKYAEENGHKQFLLACNEAIDTYSKNQKIKNQLKAAEDQNTVLRIKIVKKKNKLIVLREDFDLLLTAYNILISDDQMNKSFDQNQAHLKLVAMHERLKKMHEMNEYIWNLKQDNNKEVSQYAAKVVEELRAQYNHTLKKYNAACDDFKARTGQTSAASDTQTAEGVTNGIYEVVKDRIKGFGIFSKANELHFPYGFKDKMVDFVVGDCFFDAVIALRQNKKWDKKQLRSSISKELLKERVLYESMIEIEEIRQKDQVFKYKDFDEYCGLVATDTFPVGDVEVAIFCRLNQVSCVTVDSANNICHMYESGCATDNNPPMFLGFNPALKHYVALSLPANKSWNAMLDDLKKLGKLITDEDVSISKKNKK